MSSWFKKKRNSGPGQGVPTHAGIQSMDENLQRKFAKGIQFNMKIIIRGDRNTGKSCLYKRMEGKPFVEAYLPTDEIQVTSILWSYRVTNDTVKVEIWDIVDKGRSQKKTGRGLLKMFSSPASNETVDTTDLPLDAEFLDVYKGAHGAVFTFDMTKQWTWKYVEREVPKVPLHIPVMIMANFRDMGEHRVVSRDDVVLFIEHLTRPEGAAAVRYAEGSLKTGFGLMHIHKFLSIPFLQLQQETLLQQLQVNREQTLVAKEELDCAVDNEDQNYNLFLQKIQRIAKQNKNTPAPQSQPDPNPVSSADSSPKIPIRSNTLDQTALNKPPPPATAEPDTPQRSSSFTSKLTSKFSGFLSRNRAAQKDEIDEFVPEGEGVDSFLDDSSNSEEGDTEIDNDDDDGEERNPRVALDEDLSSPDESAPPITANTSLSHHPVITKQPLKSAKEIVLTESEESEGPSILEDEEEVVVDDYKPKLSKQGRPSTEPSKKLPITFDDTSLDQAFGMQKMNKTNQLLSVDSTQATDVLAEEDKEEEVDVKLDKKHPIVFDGDALEEMFGTPQKPVKANKVSPVNKVSPESKKRVKKSRGLMLEFSPPTSPHSTQPNQGGPATLPVTTLDSQPKDSKQKKKSKKKRESKNSTVGMTSKAENEDRVNPSNKSLAATNDPFGAIASLDAWLNSDATGKEGPLETSWSTHTPTKITDPAEESDSSDEDKQKEKKVKKHRHSKHKEASERTSSRKKHKHKSSSSSSRRHRTAPDKEATYEAF